MKKVREENELFRRSLLQTKSQKWDRFRENRALVIDKYIKQKKKCQNDNTDVKKFKKKKRKRKRISK